MLTCEQLVSSYLGSLQAKFHCAADIGDRLRIVTPYLYPDHDFIELWIKQSDNTAIVSDLGETLRHLASMGVDIVGNDKRLGQVSMIARGLEVEVDRGILVKRGPASGVADLMLDVLAACKGIADLAYTARAYEPPSFDEEVVAFLGHRDDISVEPNVSVNGQSGTSYRIAARVLAGERRSLLATISPKTQSNVRTRINAVFRMWSDVDSGFRKVTVLNDRSPLEYREEDLLLLGRVSRVTAWSAREELLGILSAA